jgi:hypothetical protein
MNEPIRLSMSTGQPIVDKIKHYPLKSIESELWDLIRESLDHKNEDHQKSNQVEFRPISTKSIST